MGTLTFVLFVRAVELSENIILLFPQGWLQQHLFFLVLLKEAWTGGEEKIASLCFWCYQENEEAR